MDDQLKIQSALIQELGLSGLPEDKQQALLEKMTEAVLLRLFTETMQRLSETDQKAYEKMIDDKAAPAGIEAFLKEKIPDYEEMAQKIVADFKEEMKKQL